MQHLGGFQQDGPFNGVFQLAYVPGPVVLEQHAQRGGGNAADGFAETFAVLSEEMASQQRNVFSALSQSLFLNKLSDFGEL